MMSYLYHKRRYYYINPGHPISFSHFRTMFQGQTLANAHSEAEQAEICFAHRF